MPRAPINPPQVAAPHFKVPFQWSSKGSAVVVEQDSADNVTQCVEAIMRTPLGFRLEIPEFGIPDPTFAGIDLHRIALQIERWEPRAEAVLNDVQSTVDLMAHTLYVNVNTRSVND